MVQIEVKDTHCVADVGKGPKDQVTPQCKQSWSF